MDFQISGEHFLLNGKEFKFISGAVHYFRSLPEDWEHILYNLKACGCNSVETYIPWNMHEKTKGEFDFSGSLDIEKFVRIAESLGLYVILRPTPYICAEWEFGGLPAWLLNEPQIKVRTTDETFLKYVETYYEALMRVITPLQFTNGGPVLMMQIENEYGSYGNEKNYLRALKAIMEKNGVNVPMFTSDGAWEATLESGSLIEDGILPTGNFGSRSHQNFQYLQSFMEKYNKKFPLMCMEFWDGWFNRWEEPIIKRDAEDLAKEVEIALEYGSVNLYMFHGGTNFGFMNASSSRGKTDLPQVTSYDYDAVLDESGNPTEKFYALQKLFGGTLEPKIKEKMEIKDISLSRKVSLFETLETVGEKKESVYPLTMEEMDSPYGYIYYQTKLPALKNEFHEYNNKIRVIDAYDRVKVYADDELLATQTQDEVGEPIILEHEEDKTLRVLVENQGRVCYGARLMADTQRKGIRYGVMSDIHFLSGWEQISLNFEDLTGIQFDKDWAEGTPAFYEYKFSVDEAMDTFLDMREFGKGVVLLNGFNLGRFWDVGSTGSLYIPRHLFQKENTLIIFETEGRYAETISFEKQPTFIDVDSEYQAK